MSVDMVDMHCLECHKAFRRSRKANRTVCCSDFCKAQRDVKNKKAYAERTRAARELLKQEKEREARRAAKEAERVTTKATAVGAVAGSVGALLEAPRRLGALEAQVAALAAVVDRIVTDLYGANGGG